jgi:hypothetical protein
LNTVLGILIEVDEVASDGRNDGVEEGSNVVIDEVDTCVKNMVLRNSLAVVGDDDDRLDTPNDGLLVVVR